MTLSQVGLERLGTQVSKKIGASKNLVINGAFQVAQRGTSSTSNGYQTVDRFNMNAANVDEAPTQAQVDVDPSAAGDNPFAKGLTKAYKITNGNQTGGAGATDRIRFLYTIEAQHIRNSGWNYTSTSSFITLSFYVKSSVSQNFFFRLTSSDGTGQSFVAETGTLSANTWTKITKIIPGNSNLQFDNDNNAGLFIVFCPFRGTDNTGTRPLNTWAAFDANTIYPDMASTWYTTNDATFEVTGVQLEVGSVATDFEHRSFAQELALCQRYFYRTSDDGSLTNILPMSVEFSDSAAGGQPHPVTMRGVPTVSFGSGIRFFSSGTGEVTPSINANRSGTTQLAVKINLSGATTGQAGTIFRQGSNGYIEVSSEL